MFGLSAAQRFFSVPSAGGHAQRLVCHEHCFGMKQWGYVEDEGRPLGVGWQKQASNRCMRHSLRVDVVSDTLKVCIRTGR